MQHEMKLLGAGRRVGLRAALAGLALLLGACAATPPPPPPEPTRAEALQSLGFQASDAGWEFSLNGKLLFETDSDELDAQSQATADRLGRELALLRIVVLRVEGHTDSVGSAGYNHALSLRRAQAVADAMVQAGLREARIDIQGLGKTLPLTDNLTPEQRHQNRRVAVIVPGL